MRIIGGKDYYDGVQTFGSDQSVIIVRNNNNITDKIPHELVERLVYQHYFKTYISLTYLYVIVADIVHYGVTIEFFDINSYNKHVHHIWSYEQLISMIEQNPKIFGSAESYLTSPKYMWQSEKRHSFENYFTSIKIHKKLLDVMIEHGYSIVVGKTDRQSNIKYTYNPCNLKDYDFQKVIPPFEMYQKLDMWISGVLLGPSPKIVTITDDKIKIAKHGFDVKTSFRKAKQT